jgi:hypothetical protein
MRIYYIGSAEGGRTRFDISAICLMDKMEWRIPIEDTIFLEDH